jgi:adenylate cyclase
MARILNTYFQALFPVVQQVGGETIDIVGDSMLAVWAGREPAPVLRERACLAALQLATASDRFSSTNPDPSLRGRLTRIGVEYGRMTMGMVGSALHLEYRPVGEPPNIATRLQELGSDRWLNTQLLVSETVIAGLDRFVVRDLGLFALRHIAHPTRVYELMGERANIADGSLTLRAAFASALADYQAGRYTDAEIKLEQLLRDHPKGDGPSRFYRRLCAEGRHYGAAPIPISGEALVK